MAPRMPPLHDGDYWETTDAFASEDIIGGGESVSKVVLFAVAPPAAGQVGWRLDFYADVPRFLKSCRGWWTWAADGFVAIPQEGGKVP